MRLLKQDLKAKHYFSYLLVWLLLFALTPLEAGLVFPEAEDELEPEAEVAEALALITAAFLS